MDADQLRIVINLLSALTAGGIIGLERSYHGRPAGFRTHTLVCLASSLLMLVTLFQWKWIGAPADAIQTDPTRMAQGIMTGVGFLGAGVIFKEGLSIRGLTTAASIWITSAIGILFGIGFYFPAIVATVLTIGVLAQFRVIEAWMPSHSYAHYFIRFDRNNAMAESEVRAMLAGFGFTVANMRYRTTDDGADFEYQMVLQTADENNTAALAAHLRAHKQVRTFQISPTGD